MIGVLICTFQVHVQSESTVADHCRSYGLSSSEIHFMEKCSQDHTDSCKQCMAITEVLEKIPLRVEGNTWNNKDAIMFKVCIIS